MIGIIIVTHGQLGAALVDAAKVITDKEPEAIQTLTIDINGGVDVDKLRSKIDKAIKQVKQDNGVIILTDMFGGSPSNLAMGAMKEADVEVVYGANLPLLVKLAKCRDKPLYEAVSCALSAGRKYCDSAGQILQNRRKRA